jgi:hypothetical protein
MLAAQNREVVLRTVKRFTLQVRSERARLKSVHFLGERRPGVIHLTDSYCITIRTTWVSIKTGRTYVNVQAFAVVHNFALVFFVGDYLAYG